MSKASGTTRKTSVKQPIVAYDEYGYAIGTIYNDDKNVRYSDNGNRLTPVMDKNGLGVLGNVDWDADWEYGLPDTSTKTDMLRWYEDFKDNKRNGYDVDDQRWTFVTSNGKVHFCDGNDDPLPKIRMKDVIYIGQINPNGETVWYDKTAKDYKEKIRKLTGYEVI